MSKYFDREYVSKEIGNYLVDIITEDYSDQITMDTLMHYKEGFENFLNAEGNATEESIKKAVARKRALLIVIEMLHEQGV